MADPLLVLGLIALCGQTCLWCGVHGAQTSRISKYETVIPERRYLKQKRQVELRDQTIQDHWEDNLSYSIDAAERTYLLMLKKNTALLSNQFTLSRYTKDGQLETSPPQKETHCYYHGRVEGVEKSMVALSTCHGLRGVIHIGDQGYGIEPMEKSTLGEHLLYKLEDVQKEPSVCGVMNSDDGWQQDTVNNFQEINSSYTGFNRQHLYRRKRDVLPVTSTVELSVMVDNYRYKMQGSNQDAVKKDVFELVNTVGAMYVPLNIRIALIELNIWIDGNPFDVMDGTAGDVLGRFSHWRGTMTGLKTSDASHLLIGRGSYNGVLGMAYVGTVCSPTVGSSISAFSNGSTPVSQATVVAHELGHNLGMLHDDGRCANTYVMNSMDMGAKNFSTCSSQDFENLILQKKGICLKNAPNPSEVLTEPMCGNNIVESGEQCDCGSVQECKNPCCQAATCTLTSGSQCAYGLCCDNCKFSGSGTVCRPQADSCDLAEYCNGSYSRCPDDFYVMDGYPCNNSQTYCYEGRCQTFDAQCKALFREGATKAPDICFQVVNLNGNSYGNCGQSGGTYKPCALNDSLCGKLQCTGTIVQPINAYVTAYDHNGIYQCTMVDFNLGTDVPDPGLVHRGTGCGAGKACVNNACVDSSKLGYDCNVTAKCNDHGLCNNKGNCHCNYGWAPPFCAGSGCGGSIDSGPSPCDNRLRDAMLILFLLVVPLLIMVIIFFKRNAIKAMIRRRKQRYRENNSTTEQTGRPKPNQNQQRNGDGNSNVKADDILTISRFPSPRPPVNPAVPSRPPPPKLDFLNKPPIPPRPQGFQNV